MTESNKFTGPSLVPPPEALNSKKLPIVTIDGPAGAGKSTAARWLAYTLGFKLIDTGALYRSLALQAIEKGIGLDDEVKLAELCSKLKFQFGNLELPPHGDKDAIPQLRIFCNEIDVTEGIRTPEMGMAASNVSKLPAVRTALLQVQRDFGVEGGIVMEGRDIGTVIFPQADLKFYLEASLESRAKRRQAELQQAGVEMSLEQIIKETKARDEQDMNRNIAPLKKADDAIAIDSTSKSFEEVVTDMALRVRSFLKHE
ncbi:MAG: (d)CMP kinase [Bdellovibrionota bacterium]